MSSFLIKFQFLLLLYFYYVLANSLNYNEATFYFCIYYKISSIWPNFSSVKFLIGLVYKNNWLRSVQGLVLRLQRNPLLEEWGNLEPLSSIGGSYEYEIKTVNDLCPKKDALSDISGERNDGGQPLMLRDIKVWSELLIFLGSSSIKREETPFFKETTVLVVKQGVSNFLLISLV